MVVTDDQSLADRLCSLRDNGRAKGQAEVTGYGFNSRLDNLHAAILSVKLKYLPRWIARRRQIATLYQEGLSSLAEVIVPPPPQSNGRYHDVFQNYAIRTVKRDELVSHLEKNGVETLISWPIPMHRQPALGLSHFRLSQTEAISREVLSLPMYPELTDEQVNHVIKVIQDFFK